MDTNYRGHPSAVEGDTNFSGYLEQAGLSASSVNEHLANLERFRGWAAGEGLDDEQVSYQDLLAWVQVLQAQRLQAATINNRLVSLTKYGDYLMAEGVREGNPARRLRVKNGTRNSLHDLFKPDELDGLYQAYKNRQSFREEKHRASHRRGVVILSLLIHQAIRSPELRRLERGDIDFDKGEVYVPATRRSAARTLKLHPSQIMPLFGWVRGAAGDQLFPGNVHNQGQLLLQQLKPLVPRLVNLQQLRASVIVQWVKQHGLRGAQYRAGHKHISSTERYRAQDLEGLQHALLQYHPLL